MPPAEPQPGRGQHGRGAANVAAGFKVDDSSLRRLNEQWAQLVRHVKEFNAELGRIKPDRLAALSAGLQPGLGGGSLRGGGGTLTSSPFTVLPTASGGNWARGGSGLIVPAGLAPAAPAAGAGGTGSGGSTVTQSPMSMPARVARGTFRGGMAVAGAAAAYGASREQNWVDSERLAQYTAWGAPVGAGQSTAQQMTYARHFWFGGNGQRGLTGGINTQDYMSGLQTLNANQGYLQMNRRSQELQLGAGRMGNLLGSYEQGAQASAGLYSAQTNARLMGIGVTAIGVGGRRSSPEQVAYDILRRIYGGRMPSEAEVAEGMQDGAPLRATLDNLGLDPEVQDFIARYGMVSARMQGKTGRLPTVGEMQRELSTTGGTSAAGREVLGGTAYDAQRARGQQRSETEQEIADHALPALRKSINQTTQTFEWLTGVMTSSGLDKLIGGATGVMAGPGSSIQGFLGSALGSAALMGLAGRMGGSRVRVPGRAAGVGSLARPAGIAGAAAVGGMLINGVVGGSSRSGRDVTGDVLGGAAAGAGMGAMVGSIVPGIGTGIGAAAGGAIGGVIGGVSNFFGEAGEDNGEGFAKGTAIGAHPEIALAAEKYLGVPYVWGGKSPKGMDCSGLVYLSILDATGAKCPLGSTGQASWAGFTEISRSQVSAGDILWWQGHVVVATSNTQCITAPRPGAYVKRSPIRVAGPSPGEPQKCLRFNGLGAKASQSSPATPGKTAQDTTGAPGAPSTPGSPPSSQAFAHTSRGGGGRVGGEEIDAIRAAMAGGGSGLRTEWSATAVAGSRPGASMSSGSASGTQGVSEQSKRSGGANDNAPGGDAVGRWAGHVSSVLAKLGMPPDWQDEVLHRINQESSGRQDVVNDWDINWQNGHPSVGLMQVIRGTFNAYAGPYKKTGPFKYGVSTDPTANIYAGLNYAQNRYGRTKVPSIMMRPGGYATGAYEVQGDQIALVHHGEMILNSRSARTVRDYIRSQEERSSTTPMQHSTGGGRGGVNVTLNAHIVVPAGTPLSQAKVIVGEVARQMEHDQRIAAVMGGD